MVYIERDLEKELQKYLNKGEILAVLGPRQCGKTTLVNRFLDRVEKKKKISRVSFDNITTLKLFENDIESFVKQHLEGFDILFIDEVHYARDGGKILKYVYDTFQTKIIISGSSAAEISIQSLKYLVGRILLFRLYPFSFREFIRAKDSRLVNIYDANSYKSVMVKEFNRLLDEYLIYGGYPRVVLAENEEEKRKVLEGIFTTYILKEIKEILELSDDDKVITLLKSLSLQIGNIINYNELSSLTGFYYKDLKKYLNILEKTFIFKRVNPFFTNKRTELVKSPKIYSIDLGFRNICIDNFSKDRTDKGALFENFIFSEFLNKGIELKYWRSKSGAEVDFILEKNNTLIPIEVKSLLKKEKMTKSFVSFIHKYNPNHGFILSLEYEGSRKLGNKIVSFVPLVKYACGIVK
jgi:hypothetical protein|tara:strand:+ start:1049 stop:2275 length:1227 start_codon:yes stop_codon:yes gene_type:complete